MSSISRYCPDVEKHFSVLVCLSSDPAMHNGWIPNVLLVSVRTAVGDLMPAHLLEVEALRIHHLAWKGVQSAAGHVLVSPVSTCVLLLSPILYFILPISDDANRKCPRCGTCLAHIPMGLP